MPWSGDIANDPSRAAHVREIRYNNALLGQLDVEPVLVKPVYGAMRAFAAFLRDPANEYRLRMQVGAMLVFHNRRVLHDPAAFNPNGGARDQLEGGFVAQDALEVVAALDRSSIDLIDISGGTYFPSAKAASDGTGRGPYFIEFAKRARAVTTKPLMLTGGFKTRGQAEEAVKSGAVDVVGLARALVLEPSLADLWQADRKPEPVFPGIRTQRLIRPILELRRDIASTVHNAHNDQFGIGDTVVNHVALVKMRPQARLNEITSRAYLWIMEKRHEPLFNFMDKSGCRIRRVCGDERPNLGKIIFRRFGYVEGERSFNVFCPFLMILLASKAPDRPSAISWSAAAISPRKAVNSFSRNRRLCCQSRSASRMISLFEA